MGRWCHLLVDPYGCDAGTGTLWCQKTDKIRRVCSLQGRNTAAAATYWARGQPADFVKRRSEHNTLILGLVAGARLETTRDEAAFRRAKEIYNHKFWNSHHANERALIPSRDVGMVDIESIRWGRLQIHEGSLLESPMVTKWDYEGDPPEYMD